MEHELVIEAGQREGQYWRGLFRYRELFYFLAWWDVLVRYKQTVIGVRCAMLRPFLTMVVFVLIFSKIAKLPGGGLFSTSVSEGSNSLADLI
jgi:homopolymeric O-antigen transport system permease protein